MKKRFLSFFIVLALFVTMLFPMTAQASTMTDEARTLEWGKTYTGNAAFFWGTHKYMTFTLSKKSIVYFELDGNNYDSIKIYNASEKVVVNSPTDGTKTYNSSTDTYKVCCSHALAAGTYYVDARIFETGDKYAKYSFTTESAVSLGRPTIKTLKNTSSKKVVLSFSASSARTGTEIMYSTSASFSSSKTVKTLASSAAVKGLTKGKTYYFKVRSYTIYGTGGTVYSAWSTVKAVKITK